LPALSLTFTVGSAPASATPATPLKLAGPTASMSLTDIARMVSVALAWPW